MKNIILLTHGEFSKGIAQSCQFILGEVPNLITLSITLDESTEKLKAMLESVVNDFGNDAQTIIVTDIPGGSTTQTAISMLEEHPELYIMSGLCLGMLLSLVMLEMSEDREENLLHLREIQKEARDTLIVVNDIVNMSITKDNGDGEL